MSKREGCPHFRVAAHSRLEIALLFSTTKSDQWIFLRQRVNTITSDDAFPQVNQDNVDAGLVQNSASVNATSPVGVTTTHADEDVEIARVSSLTVGESGDGSHGICNEGKYAVGGGNVLGVL